ncbi:hypothetical protein, partial [Streptomyces mirabilis]
DAQITVTCTDGTVFTGSYRLATTLTDARRFPAPEHGSGHASSPLFYWASCVGPSVAAMA